MEAMFFFSIFLLGYFFLFVGLHPGLYQSWFCFMISKYPYIISFFCVYPSNGLNSVGSWNQCLYLMNIHFPDMSWWYALHALLMNRLDGWYNHVTSSITFCFSGWTLLLHQCELISLWHVPLSQILTTFMSTMGTEHVTMEYNISKYSSWFHS